MKQPKLSTITPLVLATSLVFLSACSSSDKDAPDGDNNQAETEQSLNESENNTSETNETETNTPENNNPDTNEPVSNARTISYAYTFARAPDYSAGQIERISISDGNVIDGTYPATKSDHKVITDGYGLYQLGTFNIDNLTKFDPVDTSVVGYQISVLGDDPDTANPQSLAFVDDDLAYLTRRNSDTILVVDPTPEEFTPESLIKGEISLADYNVGEGQTLDLPDMTDAVIVGRKLFVLLEYLDNNLPVAAGYIAVIDLDTNLEIQTGTQDSPVKGIQLQTVNPAFLQYNESTGQLYVVGRGNYFRSAMVGGDAFTGGIESIDPDTYATTLLIDDGDESNNKGFFTEALVINDSLGYVITLDGFDAAFNAINRLRTFNPSTGELSDPVAGTEGQSLTTLALAPTNELWVGIQADSPGFQRIDLQSGEPVGERVATNYIPLNVIFLEANVQ